MKQKLRVTKTPSQCNRETTTWSWKRRSSKFNGFADTYWRGDWQLCDHQSTQWSHGNDIGSCGKALYKNSTETYVILSQSCSRFNTIFKRKKDALLPHIHIKFPDSIFDSLSRFDGKIKESVRKIMKTFGLYSELQPTWKPRKSNLNKIWTCSKMTFKLFHNNFKTAIWRTYLGGCFCNKFAANAVINN